MTQTTKQQLDAMAVADSLRPTLLRLARELRREKIASVSPHQVGLLVSIKYAPGVTVGELAAEEHRPQPVRHRDGVDLAPYVLGLCALHSLTELTIAAAGEGLYRGVCHQQPGGEEARCRSAA